MARSELERWASQSAMGIEESSIPERPKEATNEIKFAVCAFEFVVPLNVFFFLFSFNSEFIKKEKSKTASFQAYLMVALTDL